MRKQLRINPCWLWVAHASCSRVLLLAAMAVSACIGSNCCVGQQTRLWHLCSKCQHVAAMHALDIMLCAGMTDTCMFLVCSWSLVALVLETGAAASATVTGRALPFLTVVGCCSYCSCDNSARVCVQVTRAVGSKCLALSVVYVGFGLVGGRIRCLKQLDQATVW